MAPTAPSPDMKDDSPQSQSTFVVGDVGRGIEAEEIGGSVEHAVHQLLEGRVHERRRADVVAGLGDPDAVQVAVDEPFEVAVQFLGDAERRDDAVAWELVVGVAGVEWWVCVALVDGNGC